MLHAEGTTRGKAGEHTSCNVIGAHRPLRKVAKHAVATVYCHHVANYWGDQGTSVASRLILQSHFTKCIIFLLLSNQPGKSTRGLRGILGINHHRQKATALSEKVLLLSSSYL